MRRNYSSTYLIQVCIIQLIKDKQVAIKILNYCLKKREKGISIEKLLEKLPRVHPGSQLSLTPFKRMHTRDIIIFFFNFTRP